MAEALPRGDTKQRILDAAESLFVARGFSGTSLRAITGSAGVNVAAVHYHFGGRESLLRAVLHRHLDPINATRLAQLDGLEAATDDPPLEAVLEAFLGPALIEAARNPAPRQLAGLLFSEPAEHARQLVDELFAEVATRFEAALARALPALPADEVRERLRFVVGAMVHEIAGHHPLDVADRRRGTPERLRRMIRFLAAGLRAPSPPGETT